MNTTASRAVTGAFTLTAGIFKLTNQDLILTSTASLSGSSFAATKMIATTGTGFLKKHFAASASTSFTYPIGDMEGTTDYAEVYITNSGAPSAVSYIGFRVVNTIATGDVAGSDYVPRHFVVKHETVDGSGLPSGTTFTSSSNFQPKIDIKGPSTEVVGTLTNIRLFKNSGGTWTQINSGIASATNYTIGNFTGTFPAMSETSLDGYTLAGRTYIGQQSYIWTGATSTDYQVATNWNPTRTNLDVADILSFDGTAASSTVTNVPIETIGRLLVSGNAQVSLSVNSGALTVGGGTATGTVNCLNIGAGSKLTNSGAGILTFSGPSSATTWTATVDGTLETAGGNVTISSVNTPTLTVSSTGRVVVASTATGHFVNSLTTVTKWVFQNGSVYDHLRSGGTWLAGATYESGSTVNIGSSGSPVSATVSMTVPYPSTGTFAGNFNLYSSVTQSIALNPLVTTTTFTGDFNITSTALITLSGSNTLIWTFNNPVTFNAPIRFSAGTASAIPVYNFNSSLTFGTGSSDNGTGSSGYTTVNVTGKLTVKAGATLRTSNTSTAHYFTFNLLGDCEVEATGTLLGHTANSPYLALSFNGTTAQTFTPSGTLTSTNLGKINFIVNNAAGVTLGAALEIPQGSVLSLNQGAISGNTISYHATHSRLEYNGTTAQTATTNEFPASNGPRSLRINNAAGVTIPFSITIGDTLTMTAGNLTMDANNLTIGSSTTSVGTLAYTSGMVRLTTGTFKRFYPIASLPTTAVTTIPAHGYYPIAYGTNSRTVQIYFSATTAISTAGSITVQHNNAVGTTALSPTFLDGTPSMDKRSNASWALTAGDGLALSGTAKIDIACTNVVSAKSSATVNNFRVIKETAIFGTAATTAGTYNAPIVKRTNMSLADLTSTYYLGGPTANFSFSAIANGNWGDAATWGEASAPTATDDVLISAGIAVDVSGLTTPYTCQNLTNNGTITNSANTLTIAAATTNGGTITLTGGTTSLGTTLTNTGTIALTSGTVNQTATTAMVTNTGTMTINSGTYNFGPAGGYNRTFTTSAGSLTMTNGNLNINGSFIVSGTGGWSMTNGTVTIDGNSGTAVTSLTNTQYPLHLNLPTGTINVTGGTITIVDPHHSSVTSPLNSIFISRASLTGISFAGSTIQLGDGISTATNTLGFPIETVGSSSSNANVPLGNVIVNGGSTVGRHARTTTQSGNYGTIIGGSLTVTNNSVFQVQATNTSTYNKFNGDITVNSGSSFYTLGTLILEGTAAQTISGTGTFQNLTSGATANFTNVTINNSSAAGVTFSNNVQVSSNTTLTAGIINMGSNTFTTGISASSNGTWSYTAGRIIGKLKRWIPTGTSGSMVLPLGTATAQRNATLTFSAGVGTGGSLTAEFKSTSIGATGLPLTINGQTIDAVSPTGYWQIDAADGFSLGSATYTASFDATGFTGVNGTDPITVFTGLRLIKRSSAAADWTDVSATAATLAPTALNAVSITGQTSFSVFALGGTSAVLPIELKSFSAAAKGDVNAIQWTTASEKEVSKFIVERSATGVNDWKSIGEVKAAGNSNSELNYDWKDNAPFALSYYRLKSMDMDGKSQLSKVVSVQRKGDKFTLWGAFPVPFDEQVTVRYELVETGDVTLRLTDLTGKVMMERVVSGQEGMNEYSLNTENLSAGVYMIHLTNALTRTNIVKIVKQ